MGGPTKRIVTTYSVDRDSDDDSPRVIEIKKPELKLPKRQRICLVTCGATAPFPRLVEAALTPAFLEKLMKHNYTDLYIQYGRYPYEKFDGIVSQMTPSQRGYIKISGFAFGKGERWRGLLRAVKATQIDCRYDEWKVVQQIPDGIMREEGVVISHAGNRYPTSPHYEEAFAVTEMTGTGTILDVMRLNCPLVIVANPDLMDNHQEELAETMAGFEYLVHGKLTYLYPSKIR